MADILTPAELDAIRGRCEAPVPQGLLGTLEYNAHARADLPHLLAHVAALEALLATAALAPEPEASDAEAGAGEAGR